MNARTSGKVQVGDRIPDFEAFTENGDLINVEVLTGQKNIIYFYPKDDTPGCTKQACNLRDYYAFFIENGYRIYGVSKDSEAPEIQVQIRTTFSSDCGSGTVDVECIWFSRSQEIHGKGKYGNLPDYYCCRRTRCHYTYYI